MTFKNILSTFLLVQVLTGSLDIYTMEEEDSAYNTVLIEDDNFICSSNFKEAILLFIQALFNSNSVDEVRTTLIAHPNRKTHVNEYLDQIIEIADELLKPNQRWLDKFINYLEKHNYSKAKVELDLILKQIFFIQSTRTKLVIETLMLKILNIHIKAPDWEHVHYSIDKFHPTRTLFICISLIFLFINICISSQIIASKEICAILLLFTIFGIYKIYNFYESKIKRHEIQAFHAIKNDVTNKLHSALKSLSEL